MQSGHETVYTKNSMIKASNQTLSILHYVLKFDIIEFWVQEDNDYTCAHSFTAKSCENIYPGLASGASPPASTPEWRLYSTNVIKDIGITSLEKNNYIWRQCDNLEASGTGHLSTVDKEGASVRVSMNTEMAMFIANNDMVRTYVVAYANNIIAPPNADVINYLCHVVEAAHIAYVHFRGEDATLPEDLDKKGEFKPRAMKPRDNQGGVIRDSSTEADIAMGVWSAHGARGEQERSSEVDKETSTAVKDTLPTWDPVSAYNFPIATIPAVKGSGNIIAMEEFRNLKHIADGSNSNVYTAQYGDETVIVKMITQRAQFQPVAVHEFDVELGVLGRLDHCNVIKVIGAGHSPRRFVCLEYLGGGSLHKLLDANVQKGGFASKLLRRSTFSYVQLLRTACNIANGLAYLHHKVYPGATVLHRDLKPDNIGFTSSGDVKIIDFGLCTVVKAFEKSTDEYQMTGNTGSLRYMAPEVALKKPYSGKVDVYSFSIMVWQMGRDKIPFSGMNKDDYMARVARGGERPKMDKSWPPDFCRLLSSCWSVNPNDRPDFSEVCQTLEQLILAASDGLTSPTHGKSLSRKKTEQTKSTWF